jgi:hypothetical protein
VLSHYKAVVWYTGLDDYVREPGQTLGVTKMFDDQMVSIRDYINEGGKVLVTGQRALQSAWSEYAYNPLGRFPAKPQCASNTGATPAGQLENCVNVSNDFLQYWMGANARANQATTAAAVSALTIVGQAPFTGSFQLSNQSFLPRFTPTSNSLPVASFPQFTSKATHVVSGGTNAVGVSTKDTLLWGFGLENIADRATRATLIRQGLGTLGADPYTQTTGGAGGSVPATLSLTLGTPGTFGAFTPGAARIDGRGPEHRPPGSPGQRGVLPAAAAAGPRDDQDVRRAGLQRLRAGDVHPSRSRPRTHSGRGPTRRP